MRGTLALVGGAGLGAGLMYLLDPDRGERRRARLGDVMGDAAERLSNQDVLSSVREAGARFDAPRLVSGLAAVAREPRSLRPAWRNGRLSFRRRHPMAGMLDEHRWSLLGVAAGILAAGVWGVWRRQPGEVRESVMVNAPPERVYETWTRFENFPRFMPAVREVRSTGVDRNQWVINGPAGTPVEFESVVTRREAPSALAWRTVEGALVSHGGTARFRRAGAGQTRVDVTMWWRPTGGGIGEGVATLSGIDPARVLREGLNRFKAELEQERSEPGTHGVKR